MEPPAKRPRLVRDIFCNATQLTEASRHHHNDSQPLTRFEGYGVQNTGNFEVSRDLIITVNQQPTTNTEVDERQVLLDSLRFDQIDARQLSIKKAHTSTCAWFLKTPEYVNWTRKSTMHNRHNFLWIKGKPGAGKLILMKFLLGKLSRKKRQAKKQGLLLSFFFNARSHDLEKTTTGLYQSLLLQLLEARPDLQYVLEKVRIQQP